MNSNMIKVQKSKIREFTNKVLEVEDSVNLTLGQPDFKLGLNIKNKIIEAINEDKTIYTDNYGLYELRLEISKYLSYKQIYYNPEEIIITSGSSEALFSAIVTIINPGDKVLLPNITYPAYENIINMLGGEILNYNLDSDFKIDKKDFMEKINEDIKIVIFCYPSNPTGSILNEEDAIFLKEILKEKEVYIISDEVYEAFSYERNYSLSQYEVLKCKLIYIGGFSKMFSATGIRIGYLCCNDKLIKEVAKTHQYNVACASSIGQYAMIEALKNNLYLVDLMKEEFIKRRDYCINRMKERKLKFIKPDGGFYIFMSISEFGLKSEEFCIKLLNTKKVACVPGDAFGSGGEGYIRISFCYSLEHLKRAFDLIDEFIIKFNKIE